MSKNTSDSKEGNLPKKSQSLHVLIQVRRDSRWKVFTQSAYITLASIFSFALIGWGIDYLIGEGHIFLIVMLILSYPITQIVLYKKFKNFNSPKK